MIKAGDLVKIKPFVPGIPHHNSVYLVVEIEKCDKYGQREFARLLGPKGDWLLRQQFPTWRLEVVNESR